MKKLSLYFLFLILCSSSSIAQDLAVSIAFDTTKILIGDQINFTVAVTQPKNILLDLPAFSDTIISNIEIVNGPVRDTVPATDGMIDIIDRYLVTSFDSGFYEVKPVYVEVKNDNGLKRFYSGYARLEVAKYRVAPVDTTARIYDIVGPYKAPVTLGDILPWILLAVIVAAAIWIFFIFLRKFKKQKPAEEIPLIIESAHVIAFRELEKLKSEALNEKGEYKLFYTRLTEILRQYLENRYGVYSLELTTTETLQRLVEKGFKKNESYNRLKAVLTFADLVKFAKYIPQPDEYDIHYEEAWKFVDDTREIPMIVNPQEDRKEDEK
ncbi:MAG TPA: hypothetical protein VK213_00700 [Bacteroidales bacterium]|nr:hypothetical protein [Bacteroidales bacterium]